MRRLYGIASLLVAIVISSAAVAADNFPSYKAPPVPYAGFDWTGLRIGVNAGGGFGEESTGIAGGNALGAVVVRSGLVPSTLKTTSSGAVAGGQISYLRQFGLWVLGAEVDGEWTNVKGSDSKGFTLVPFVPVSINTVGESRLNWYTSFVGKAGFTPVERLLVYGKAGGVYGNYTNSVSTTLSAPAPFGAVASASADQSKLGYTVGGGAEFMLTPQWSLGVDYSYLNFGTTNMAYAGRVNNTPVAFTASHEDAFHVGKATLNYKFDVPKF